MVYKMKISDILNYLREIDIEFEFQGTEETEVSGFSSLNHYREGTFTWIKKQAYLPVEMDCSLLKLVFVSESVVGDFPNVIRTSASKHAFFSTIDHFYGAEEVTHPVIGQGSYISPDVKLGEHVRIGHNCTLDGHITIGDNTTIWNNVSIVNHVSIGRRTEIHSGVIIGHDDLAYTEENGFKQMIKHYGGVDIGDDVTIGANTIINRGTIDNTTIGNNCIIDGQCHISHNVVMDDGVTLISGTRLYGSVHVKENAYITSAIIKNQCSVGKNAVIGMGAVAVKDVLDDTTVIGIPARPMVKKKSDSNMP